MKNKVQSLEISQMIHIWEKHDCAFKYVENKYIKCCYSCKPCSFGVCPKALDLQKIDFIFVHTAFPFQVNMVSPYKDLNIVCRNKVYRIAKNSKFYNVVISHITNQFPEINNDGKIEVPMIVKINEFLLSCFIQQRFFKVDDQVVYINRVGRQMIYIDVTTVGLSAVHWNDTCLLI